MSENKNIEEEFDENNPPTDIGPVDPKNIPPRAPRAPKAERAPKAPRAERAPKAPRAEKAPQAEKAPRAEKAPKAEIAPILDDKSDVLSTSEKPTDPNGLGSIMSIAKESNSENASNLAALPELIPNTEAVSTGEKIENSNLEIKSPNSEAIKSETPALQVKEEMAVAPNESQNLYVKLLNDSAKAPTRGSKFAAGYDLYASEEVSIPRNSRGLVSTGLSMAIPVGYYGRVASRSSIALTKSVDVSAGVIDSDYRGEVKVLLVNNSSSAQLFAKGDRIAQLIIEKITTPEVAVVENLDDTDRGTGGFGSTGK